MKLTIFSNEKLIKFAIFIHDRSAKSWFFSTSDCEFRDIFLRPTELKFFQRPIDKIWDFSAPNPRNSRYFLRPMDRNLRFFPQTNDEIHDFYPWAINELPYFFHKRLANFTIFFRAQLKKFAIFSTDQMTKFAIFSWYKLTKFVIFFSGETVEICDFSVLKTYNLKLHCKIFS